MQTQWETYKQRFDIAHCLKIHPGYFKAIVDGRKRHEIRKIKNRTFEEGQDILLQEWSPATEQYTGRELIVRITYITDGETCLVVDLPDNICVFSITTIEQNLEYQEE